MLFSYIVFDKYVDDSVVRDITYRKSDEQMQINISDGINRINKKVDEVLNQYLNHIDNILTRGSGFAIKGYSHLNMEIIQITRDEHANVFVQNKELVEILALTYLINSSIEEVATLI